MRWKADALSPLVHAVKSPWEGVSPFCSGNVGCHAHAISTCTGWMVRIQMQYFRSFSIGASLRMGDGVRGCMSGPRAWGAGALPIMYYLCEVCGMPWD